MTATIQDSILAKYRATIGALYGEQIDRIILFGSRSRGEAQPDSDYDIAIFLKSLPNRWSELNRLADIRVQFLEESGAFFDAFPYPAAAYNDDSPLMYQIRREGVEL